jgi:hypothetical protein
MSEGGAWTPDYVTITPAQELPSAGWGLDLSSLPAWLTDMQKVAQLGVDTYSKVYQIQNSGSSGQSPAPQTANLPAPLPSSPDDAANPPAAPVAPGGFTQDMSDFYEAHKTAVIIGGIAISGIVLIALLRAANKRGR